MKNKPNSTDFCSLTFEQWETKFQPIKNTLTENAAFNGFLFETYGDELKIVLAYANGHTGREPGARKVWTLLENDLGESVICEGYHLCNRLGYFITAKPAAAGRQYEVTEA